jgi:hypothetical protein
MTDTQADTLSLLEAGKGKRATKQWTEDGIEGYDAGGVFSHRTFTVSGIKELSDNLMFLASNPRQFIIRGHLKSVDDLKEFLLTRAAPKSVYLLDPLTV